MIDIPPLEELYQEEIYAMPAKTMVLLSRSWHETDNKAKSLLENICNAVKLTLSSVQIISTHSLNSQMIEALNPERIIIFDPKVDSSIPLYEITTFHGVPAITSDTLEDLEKDGAKKKLLWKTLQEFFPR